MCWAANNPREHCIFLPQAGWLFFLPSISRWYISQGLRITLAQCSQGINPRERSPMLARRKLITAGLTAAASASGLGVAVRLANRYGLIPPDSGGIYGVGETLTYAAQRILMSRHSLAREFN